MDSIEIRERFKETFRRDVEMHTQALSRGESKVANKINKRLHKLYNQVKDKNMTDLFEELITTEDKNLQYYSAVFSLKTAPDKALQSLNKLTREESILGMTAKMTIQLWKQGKLDLL